MQQMIELVSCDRYGTRLTAASCARFKESQPLRCRGCAGHSGVVMHVNREVKEADVANHKKHTVCVRCEKRKEIKGRRMCSSCYQKVLADEKVFNKVKEEAATTRQASPFEFVSASPVQSDTSMPWPGMPEWFSELFAGEDDLAELVVASARTERRDHRQQVLHWLDMAISEVRR